MQAKRIVLAGGGTAGHVNPMLATATVLRGRGHDIHILGTEEGLERQLVPAAGFPMSTIPKVPIPRRPTFDWLTLPQRLSGARSLARAAVKDADVVVGFGGYVAAPAYMGARKEGIPFVIHEQNARPGLANRMGAKNAAAVCLTFSDTQLVATHGTTEVTGLPLRGPIADLALKRKSESGRRAAREEAAAILGLDPELPTLLITGGSLGAQHLNEVFEQAAADLPEGTQVLHLTGSGKAESLNVPWITMEYLSKMELALASADLVVCRSGAGTVAELAQLGLPAVFVPLAIGNGEQRLNAAAMVAAGGALLVRDSDFRPQVVREQVFPLLTSPQRLHEMGEAAATTALPGAAERVADVIEAVAK